MSEEEVDGSDGPRDLVPSGPVDPVDRAVTLLRMDVPVDERAFDAGVMAAIRRGAVTSPPRPHRRMRRGALWVGGAAIAASIAGLLMIQLSGRAHGITQHSAVSAARATNTTSGVTTVAMHPDSYAVQLVRFRLAGAHATRVTIAGTFNGWSVSATPLRQIDPTTWVVDVPLRAGRYAYQFVLDNRKWVPDPHAPRDAVEDFGTSNSVVTVTGGSGS